MKHFKIFQKMTKQAHVGTGDSLYHRVTFLFCVVATFT